MCKYSAGICGMSGISGMRTSGRYPDGVSGTRTWCRYSGNYETVSGDLHFHLLVGDSFALDVQGAVDAGFEAVWIAPPAKAVAAARGATPHLYLSTLETLPAALEWFG